MNPGDALFVILYFPVAMIGFIVGEILRALPIIGKRFRDEY